MMDRVETILPADQGFDCPVEDSLGTRRSIGTPGFPLITSEFLKTEAGKSHLLELVYRCEDPEEQVAGFLKIKRFEGEQLGHSSRIVPLSGTGGKISTITTETSPSADGTGQKIEVYAFETELELLNIRACSCTQDQSFESSAAALTA